MGYQRIHFVKCVEEFNERLDFCRRARNIKPREIMAGEKCDDNAYLTDSMVYTTLTYKAGGKFGTYVFRKDGQEELQSITGGDAYAIMKRYYNVPDIDYCDWSSRAILYKNPKYEYQRIDNCICYDINSAYCWGLTQELPDTSIEPHSGNIKAGEIGFMDLPTKENRMCYSLTPVFSGYASYIFPKKIIEPLDKFGKTWYNHKRNAITIEKRQKAKDVINFSIGMLQHHNPFLRAAIIGYCNERIRTLIDSDTLFCNTDSLVSKKRRPDIELMIGDELGQFKIEKTGAFAYRGYNYQWNNDVPSYRGIPKKWFPKGYDILKDKIPFDNNVYYLNWKRLKMEEKNGTKSKTR